MLQPLLEVDAVTPTQTVTLARPGRIASNTGGPIASSGGIAAETAASSGCGRPPGWLRFKDNGPQQAKKIKAV